jgi:Ulp1 family protease
LNSNTFSELKKLKLEKVTYEVKHLPRVEEILGFDPQKLALRSVPDIIHSIQEAHKESSRKEHDDTFLSSVNIGQKPRMKQSEPPKQYGMPTQRFQNTYSKSSTSQSKQAELPPPPEPATPKINRQKLVVCKYNIEVTEGDMERLNDGEFLNDNIIDFWYM